jgi:sulfur-carrier protein
MPAPEQTRVRLFAAARDAAGVAELTVPGRTPVAVIAELRERFGPAMQRVLAVSSLLVDGRTVPATSAEALPNDCPVDVLPPFAGG